MKGSIIAGECATKRISGSPNVAFSAAMTMSAVIARTLPAASAKPFTAAMVGCRRCQSFIRVRADRCLASQYAVAGMSGASWPGDMSYPAENALPSPVSISTLMSWSLCTSSSASLNSRSKPVLRAFIFAGRVQC